MMTIQEQALALRGKKSLSLIADQLGTTRSVVAGIFFRTDNPHKKTNGKKRGGKYGNRALECRPSGRHPGIDYRSSLRRSLDEIVRICNSDLNDRVARRQIAEIARAATEFAADRIVKRQAKRTAAKARA